MSTLDLIRVIEYILIIALSGGMTFMFCYNRHTLAKMLAIVMLAICLDHILGLTILVLSRITGGHPEWKPATYAGESMFTLIALVVLLVAYVATLRGER